MAQADPGAFVDTEGGTAHVSRHNTVAAAMLSQHSGASRPSYAVAGTIWVDTDTPSATVNTVFYYDGTDDIPIGYVDVTNNVFWPSMAGVGEDILPDADSTRDLGSAAKAFAESHVDAPHILGQKIQGFTFFFHNSGGTLNHRIRAAGGVNATFADKITGATNGDTASPTGADASTAFAGGGKVSTNRAHGFMFDTAAQTIADLSGVAVITVNTTGTDLSVQLLFENYDVNGTTRVRPLLMFTDAATGADFNLTTGNVTSGKVIQVPVMGYLA